MKITLKVLLFLFAVALPQITTGKVAAQTDSPKKITGSTQIKSKYGYSFRYRNCWSIVGDDDDLKISDDITMHTTSACPISEQGTWAMGPDRMGNMNYSNEDYMKDRGKTYINTFHEARKVSKYNALLFSGVKAETNALIDIQDQNNYEWTLKVICKKSNIVLVYLDHINKSAREKARKKPEMPAVFKELIAGFSCE